MSIKTGHFVILGCDVELVLEERESFDSNIEVDNWNAKDKIGNFVVLIDGMNGNYSVIGKLIDFGNEVEGLDFKHYDLNSLIGLRNEVVAAAKSHNFLIEPEQVGLIVVTHYS